MRVRTAYHVFVIDSNVETILSLTKWEREFLPGYHFSSLNRLCLLHNPYGFFWILQVIKVNSKGKKRRNEKTEKSLNLRKELSFMFCIFIRYKPTGAVQHCDGNPRHESDTCNGYKHSVDYTDDLGVS